MKRYILFLPFIGIFSGLSAQQSNSLQREVVIEKEFTPIVQDASKINTIPEMEVSAPTRPDIKYAEWSSPYKSAPALTRLDAGDSGAEAPDKQHGYARFSIGNYLNIVGNAGIRIVNTAKDQLLLWYGHNSTNGNLSYIETREKIRQKRYDNKVNLKYAHLFQKGVWDFAANYRYNNFNYYGLPLAIDKNDYDRVRGITDRQIAQQYGFSTAFRTVGKHPFNYTVNAGYQAHNNYLGLYYGDLGGIENHITAGFDGYGLINDDYKAGLALTLDNLVYNRCDRKNYAIVGIEPYFAIEKKSILFKAGAKIDLSFRDNTIFRIAPDVKFEWTFGKAGLLYAHLTGGKSINSWYRMSNITSYIDPSNVPANTYTPADLSVGFRSSVLKKVHFALYGGIKSCVDAPFDYRMQHSDITETSFWLTRNVVSFYAADAYAWKAGAEIEYEFRDFLTARLAWDHNEWHRSGSRERIAFSEPRDEWTVEITATPVKPLDIKAGFYFAGGLGYENLVTGNIEYPRAEGSLPNIADLHVGATYRLNKMIHFSAQVNNILARRYEIFYGMPSQRFHFLVGMGVVF